MSIYTRFGSKIIILRDVGEGFYKVKRVEDGTTHDWHIQDFKADGGLQEIQEAIKNLE